MKRIKYKGYMCICKSHYYWEATAFESKKHLLLTVAGFRREKQKIGLGGSLKWVIKAIDIYN